ncbi:aminopeptidase N [Drosophila bipectinata]|uniref:aminopeptidase N n=1 Tax=Drosophila bipectinata TaxID=42026 RepID=UPI001C899378|nr:aminopeptidase N [Drosophila bipectinata]
MLALQTLVLIFLVPGFAWAEDDHYRLPSALEPQHYDLRVLTHLDGGQQRFEGSVKIRLLAREATRNITLHVRNLDLIDDRTSVTSREETNCVVSRETDDVYDFYTLHLCEELRAGEVYQLEMHFRAELDSNSGYYRSNYTDPDTKEVHHMAVTQFSPTFARQAFPCFDEPSWKSTFDITLGFHRNYTGLSNMPVQKCLPHDSLKDYTWCQYEPLLRTSTYLVAYAVHDLRNAATVESKTRNRVTFGNWMQPKFVNKNHFFVPMAPKALEFLEELFNLSFPLRKVDQLIVPYHRFPAMENWGLVTFNELNIVHTPDDVSVETHKRNAFTLAHEYAHQWFGNMVTMKWWDDLWLKEGPSTYFGYLALDALEPQLRRGERFIQDDLAYFFKKDSGSSVPAMSKEVRDPNAILGQFTEYVYKKGSLIVRMLHKILGSDVFFSGTRSFLKKYALKNVDQRNLWEAFQEVAVSGKVISEDFNLSRAMDSWTLQGGYPLVTVIRDYESGKISLNQTRFLLGQEKENITSCWWVPLRFVRQGALDFSQTSPESWLGCPSSDTTIKLSDPPGPDEWLILNPQVSTIFRVNYDDHNWRLIKDSLNQDQSFGGIHELNRAQLLDDLAALASVRIRKYDEVFDLLEYLKNEPNRLPWDRAVQVLERLGALLSGQEELDFKTYMKKLILPLYKRFPKLALASRRPPSPKDVPFHRFVYSQACRFGVEDCLLQARLLTLSHRNGTQLEVPSNFREVAYCSVLENGGQAEFSEVFQLFQSSTDAAEQSTWASALGCCPNFELFEQFLNFTLQSNEKSISDCYMLAVKKALNRRTLAPQTAQHIMSQAKLLGQKFKMRDLTSLLVSLAENLQKPEALEELSASLKDMKEFEKPLEMALNLAKTNLVWQKECSSDFSQALRKHI